MKTKTSRHLSQSPPPFPLPPYAKIEPFQSRLTMSTVKAGTRPPWVGLGAAVWVQIAAGNAYNFPLYSHSLKAVLGFSQSQVTMIGVANDIGENMGILPGLVCNRFPPWLMLLIGGFSCFLGYGVLWLSVSRTVQPLPYWLVYVSACSIVSFSLMMPLVLWFSISCFRFHF